MKQLTVTAFLLFTCAASFAQRDSTKHLKEVQVIAVPTPPVQTLLPSQTLKARDFKRNGAYNVADAIRNFSGVNIKDYGGIGGLKTVSVRSLGANHTGVQFDGVQVTDAQNGQIDLGKINLDNVASITLYNGQAEDLLQPARAFASASMLVIKSLAPQFTPEKNYHLNLGFKTGSFGLIHPSLRYQQKISNKWTLNFSNSWQKAHGRYRYQVDGDGSDTLAIRNNADLDAFQSDAAVYWNGADSNRFQFRINYANSNRGLPGAVVFYNPYSNQHLWNRDLFLQSNYTHQWNNGFRLLLNGKVSNNYVRYLDPDYLNIAGMLEQTFKQTELYESIALSYQASNSLAFSLASDVAYNKLNTNLYNYAYPSRLTFLTTMAAQFKVDKLHIQANLLNTTINEVVEVGSPAPSKSIWSPAISASYEPFEETGLQLRAFYKDIFRNPTFNDLYYTRAGKRDLKPEYTKQYNLGITYSKNYTSPIQFLTLTADAYYNEVNDKIIAIPNKDLFTWTMMNLGNVDIRGLDLSMKTAVSLSNEFTLNLAGNYTYQKAIDVTDPGSTYYLHNIPYTPEHTLAMNLGLSKGPLSLYYNHIYSSSRYYLSENLPAHYVSGFSVSDASLSYQMTAAKLPIHLSLEVNNLFNHNYAFIRSFPMPGRSFRLSFQITI
ncbi:outer membrane receptor for ferrienterochelin and colicin [Pedobacter sp. CAN_A7]|uniref:TonB-dependent receptor plug domain-containing protein n=1 Tax=Pedobacter sp. CAN_A7 TaxID=2787722 RepID=UPI0018CA3965